MKLFVNNLLDNFEITDIDDFTCKLGEVTIWIENRPYGSGWLYNSKLTHLRPSRLTIKRLLKKVDEIVKKDKIQEIENYRNMVGLEK